MKWKEFVGAVSGRPRDDWEEYNIGHGLKARIREEDGHRGLILEPSKIHPDCKDWEIQGLYISAPLNDPVWTNIVSLCHGAIPDA